MCSLWRHLASVQGHQQLPPYGCHPRCCPSHGSRYKHSRHDQRSQCIPLGEEYASQVSSRLLLILITNDMDIKCLRAPSSVRWLAWPDFYMDLRHSRGHV